MYINKEVQIELSKNYEIEDLKNIVVAEFKNNYNAGFLQNRIIEIGKKDPTVIPTFIDFEINKNNMWKYLGQLANTRRRITILILTTGKEVNFIDNSHYLSKS